MAKFSPLQPFDFACSGGWKEWKTRFERYRIATKLHKDDKDVQDNALIYVMGEEAEHLFTQFGLSADDQKKYEKVMEKFNEHFKPSCKNAVHERVMFQSITQTSNIGTFIRDLYKQAESCEFGSPKLNPYVIDSWQASRIKMCPKSCS
jgi:hypothetical protein